MAPSRLESNEAEAVRVLMENYEIGRAMFRLDIKGGSTIDLR
jgi:hypothetical protein